jgi:hypothetical protein
VPSAQTIGGDPGAEREQPSGVSFSVVIRTTEISELGPTSGASHFKIGC